MTSALSVNQIRLFSSVALEKAEKFMLAASCSAADAIMPYPHPKALCASDPLSSGFRRLGPGLSLGGGGGAAHNDLAARRLDRGDRALRRACDLDRDGRREPALGQQPDAVARPPQQACRDELGGVERALAAEPPGIERLLQPAKVHHGEILAEDVVEPALRQPPMQRRLAAFKAVERDPGARGLALAAAARGLALARSDAAPYPLRPIMRARIVSDFVEFH